MRVLISLVSEWFKSLPLWKTDSDNLNKELLKFFIFALILSAVGIAWSRAEAQELAYGESHGYINEFAASLPGPKLRWTTPVKVFFYGEEDIQKELEYAIWSWSERTGHPISYAGKTNAIMRGSSGVVTVKIESAFNMPNMLETKGNTEYWFYPDSGVMAGSIIKLSDIYFLKNSDGKVIMNDCTIQTLVHEIGHAIGALHTSETDDVMHPYGAVGCRYSLSPNDIDSTNYEKHECFVELTMENDLYIPNIHGKRASLKKQEGFLWKLESLNDNPAATCSNAKADDDLTLTIQDIRGKSAQLWARFKYIGNDQWRLYYAE